MMGLTHKQRELLEFIKAYQAEKEFAPSFHEMSAAMGLRSKSGIHRLLSSLEERGYIRRLSYRARSIEILPQSLTTDQIISAINLHPENADDLERIVRAATEKLSRATCRDFMSNMRKSA